MRKIKNILIATLLIFNGLNLVAQTETSSSKIVKIGDLNIDVSNYNKTIFKIDSLVSKLNGFIAEENEANFKAKITNEIIIRVPSKNFATLVYKITEIADKVNTKDIKAIKVDKAISDLTERLNSKEDIKARYLSLVEKSKVSIEIAELETKISHVSSEIHLLQKKIGNYKESTVSTLNIYMKQQLVVKGQNVGAVQDLSKSAMAQLLKNILLYSLIPVILLIGYYFLIHKRIQKEKRKKRRSKTGQKSPW